MLVLDNLIYRWQRSGGISTVWYELTKRIVERCDDYCFLEYANSIAHNHLRATENIPSEKIKVLDDRLFAFKRYMPVHVGESGPFLFHSSYYRTCSDVNAVNIITLHDFTYEYFRHGISKAVHCFTKHKALRDADVIVCISDNTKKDLLKLLPDIDASKVRVIYNGVSDSFCPLGKNIDDYLLFVGARGGYKNFKFAAECAAKAGLPLVVCGRDLDRQERKFLDGVLPGKYFDKGFVTETELNELYNGAFALIYPSSYEGFGIPVLEAQKAGCPVLAINSSSIPEVIGDKEILCNALNEAEMLEKIKELKKKNVREHVIQKGLLRSLNFSWDKTFNQYMSLYREFSL